MGRITGLRWERTFMTRPAHNIISSDFPRYQPQPWKFTEGPASINLLLANEYQRMWVDERDQWKKRMYPENVTINVDLVKKYVLTFKTAHQKPKPEKKKPFQMKKFQNIPSKTSTKRPANDKAMRKRREPTKKIEISK